MLREEARERRLKEQGADFFLADLSNHIITIKYYDDVDNLVFATLEDGREVKIIAQGSVAKRKLRAIREWMAKNKGAAVRVKVVMRKSEKTGREYIDLVDPGEELGPEDGEEGPQ